MADLYSVWKAKDSYLVVPGTEPPGPDAHLIRVLDSHAMETLRYVLERFWVGQ